MTLSYDAMVEALTRQGVPRPLAERRARQEHGLPAEQPSPLSTAAPERRDDILEKDEQREIRKLFLVFGFKVYWLSQARKTGQTKGLPDLWCIHPDHVDVHHRVGLWWETKRQRGGRHSDEQSTFGKDCHAATVLYGTGDRYDAAAWLRAHGFTDDGPEIYPPTPKRWNCG